jgi:hypothetical protein
MRKVYWNGTERWCNHHHFSCLIEDVTAFNLNESLCTETVKYMAKRLRDTPYHRAFRNKYSIYQDEYKALVEKFNSEANNNGRLVVE